MLKYLFAMLLLASPAMADSVYGIWQTAKDDNGDYGHVEVAACGDLICGTLIVAFDSAGTQIDSDNIGKLIVWNMRALGDGAYGKGKVWSPDRDKTYRSKMTLRDDVLAVKGCVLGICRDGGRWTRVK